MDLVRHFMIRKKTVRLQELSDRADSLLLVCSLVSNQSLIISSVSEGAGTLSSIVFRTAAGAGVGQVPLKVVIDEFEVKAAKRFLYKKNPVIKSVTPLCSLQR